jgi:hypothetical protein
MPYNDVSHTNTTMNNTYTQQIAQQDKEPASKSVPDWYAQRYPDATYEDYQEALADFMNGI